MPEENVEARTAICKFCENEYEIDDDHPDNDGYCFMCYYLLFID